MLVSDGEDEVDLVDAQLDEGGVGIELLIGGRSLRRRGRRRGRGLLGLQSGHGKCRGKHEA
jgi:hypothetical protein